MNILDLSSVLVEAAELDIRGVYHMVGAQAMSKFQFGVVLAEQFGFDTRLIKPVSVNDSGLKAARSPNLSLSTEKIVKALGHELPDFHEGVKKFFDQYRRGYPQYIMSLNG